MQGFLKMGLFALAYANVAAALQLSVATNELCKGDAVPFDLTWWVGHMPVTLVAVWLLTTAAILVHNKGTSGQYFSSERPRNEAGS